MPRKTPKVATQETGGTQTTASTRPGGTTANSALAAMAQTAAELTAAAQAGATTVTTAARSGADAATTTVEAGVQTVSDAAQAGAAYVSQAAQAGATMATRAAERTAASAQAGAERVSAETTKAVDFATTKVKEGAAFAQQKAEEGAAFAAGKAMQAADFTEEKARQGAAFTEKKAKQAADFTQEKAKEAYDFAYDKATDGVDLAVGTFDKYTHTMKLDETFAAKGGTAAGFAQAQGMVTADATSDAAQRFAALEKMLVRQDAKGGPRIRQGTLAMFNKLTPLLAGGGVLAGMRRQRVAGVDKSLEEVLRVAFADLNTWSGSYLVSMLQNDGVPSKEMQILDAMGLVTVRQTDPKRKNREAVFRGICRDMTRAEAVAVVDSLRKKRKIRRADMPRPLRLLAQSAADADTLGAPTAGQAEIDAWAKEWDARLAKEVLRTHKRNISGAVASKAKGLLEANRKKWSANIVATVRKTLARVIAGEMEHGQLGVARAQLAQDHSQFEAALKIASKYVDAQLQTRMITAVTTGDEDLLLVAEDAPADRKETAEQTALREETDRKIDAKNLAAVGTARAMMGSGGQSPKDLERRGDLVKFVRKMTPEARRMLVASHLDATKRQTYLQQKATTAELDGLFEEAWAKAGGLRDQIEAALFDQEALDEMEKSKKGTVFKKSTKTDEEKADIPHLKTKVVLLHSMLRFSGDAGPNYLALVAMTERPPAERFSTITHGTRIWEIAQRMKGVELYQVRHDVPLLLKLRKLCKADVMHHQKGPHFFARSTNNWDKLVALLQLPDTLRIGKVKAPKDAAAATSAAAGATAATTGTNAAAPTTATAKVKPTLTNVAVTDAELTGEESLHETYQQVVDNVEFSPAYWVMHLHRLTNAVIPSLSDTYSVVSRAQIAAQRWAAAHEPPGTEAAFMRNVWDAMKPKDQGILRKKVPEAAKALESGQHLDVQVRLDRAGGHKLAGTGYQTTINANKAAIVSSFEDLEGHELMEQWSNFDELRTMRDELLQLVTQASALDATDADDQATISDLQDQMSDLEGRMARFWPSIRGDRMAYLEANLGGGTRMQVIGMLATKLSGAMRGDAEFRKAAEAAGLVADDYSAEQLQFGYLMNKRRQLDTGLQFGAASQFDVVRLGPSDALQLVMKGGTAKVNQASSQARKAQSNIYLAKIRTTQAQLAKVRADTSLDPAARAAQAKQVREDAAADVERTRTELEKRNKGFEKGRQQFQKGLEKIAKIVFAIAVGAATFGQGTVAVIVGSILGGIAREAGAAVARWIVQGDAYEHKDLARAIAIGAVKGALKAATAEVMTAIDAGASMVAADPMAAGAIANHAIYGQLAMNAAIGAAVRSAVVDIPAQQLKYLLTVERPFRDFGRNLDVMLATHGAGIVGRQVSSVLGAVFGQAAADVDALISQAAGPQPTDTAAQQAQAFFVTQGQTSVNVLMSQLQMLAKKAKLAIKLMVKSIWGKYPELWKKLANESVNALQRAGVTPTGTAASLPSAAEIDRVVALAGEIAAGRKQPSELDDQAKRSIGLLIAHAKAAGEQVP